MTLPVADRSSNKNEQIVHAAEVLGRSPQRIAVFTEIYRGRKQIKSVSEIVDATGLARQRVLDLSRGLANNDLVTQTTRNGELAYQKIQFFAHHREKILRSAGDQAAQDRIPTKRNPKRTAQSIALQTNFRAPKKRVDARHITVDDIESFSKVHGITEYPDEYTKIPETKFKNGVAAILGEKDRFKDWGGELNDLSSTKVRIAGKRLRTAFAFKGPGKTGKLTPGKMGKNGDQIQRLFRCPADIFIVQYWREIDDSVQEQMIQFAQLRSYFENRTIWYGIIDGDDSNRLMLAYPSRFPDVVIT